MKTLDLIPKITLWTLLAVGLAAICAVFLGGDSTEYLETGEYSAPNFTDHFLMTNYVFFGLAVLATIFFVVVGFIANLKKDKKSALVTLGILVAFVLLFVLCWFLGSPEKLDIVGYEGTDNVGTWAQLADMVMYVCYILFAGTLVAALCGWIYTAVKK